MDIVDVISKSMLFSKIEESEISKMLPCLNAKTVHMAKGSILIHVDEPVRRVGIVISGLLSAIKEDANGERSLIAQFRTGNLFAEALCCVRTNNSPISVVAEQDSTVVWIDFNNILEVCRNNCKHHFLLVENMLFVLANKNLNLQTRMEYLSKKTIRERLLKYLTDVSAGTQEVFYIPFNREELADYLCVNRSALSREISNLKDEGVIDYHKNKFKLLCN